MKNVEDTLREMSLKTPSREFEASMERAFRDAAARPASWRDHPVRLWNCVLACGLCALIAFALGLATVLPYALSSHRESIVYLIPHQGPAERNVFDVAPNEPLKPRESKPWTVWRGEARAEPATDSAS